MVEEFHPSQIREQPMLPPFALDRKSQICFDSYAYLRQLAEKNKKKSDDTYWLQGDGFKLSISLDADGNYQSTEIPPYIAIEIWPSSTNKRLEPETMIIYPHNPQTGETQNQYPQAQLSIVSSDPLLPPPGIKWLSNEHQQAAKAVLFIDNLISNQVLTSSTSPCKNNLQVYNPLIFC